MHAVCCALLGDTGCGRRHQAKLCTGIMCIQANPSLPLLGPTQRMHTRSLLALLPTHKQAGCGSPPTWHTSTRKARPNAQRRSCQLPAYLVLAGVAAHIQEVGWGAAPQLDDVHSCHGQARTIDLRESRLGAVAAGTRCGRCLALPGAACAAFTAASTARGRAILKVGCCSSPCCHALPGINPHHPAERAAQVGTQSGSPQVNQAASPAAPSPSPCSRWSRPDQCSSGRTWQPPPRCRTRDGRKTRL